MRTYLLALAALPLTLSAQWQPVSMPVTANLYSIDGYDAQNLCIGTTGSWLRSTNGGNSWQEIAMMDPLGFQLIGNTFFAMDYRSGTDLLGTGLSLVNTNPFEVRRSTNGGSDWPTAYTSSGDGFLSSLNNMAFNGSTGVAVGDLGRIIRSTNGGVSWSSANTSGEALFDVALPTATTAIAVGQGRILRSTNSGQSWSTVHTLSGTLYAVSFVSATTGYAAGTEGDLLRTTDGGASWAPLGAQVPDELPFFRDLWFTSATEAYGLGGDLIVHSADGGLHWGSFDAGAEMRQLFFQSPTNGFAVGYSGTVYRTGGSGDYHPYALFDAPSPVCHDSLVTFQSLSGPGLTHQWLVNGVPVGTGEALDWTFADASQNATVTLVVDNGTWSDTTELTLGVPADLSFTIAGTIGTDTVCAGGSTTVQVPASDVGTSYRLYRGNTPQGGSQNGNGNALTFPTGAISAPQTFYLVGTRNAGSCGTGTDTLTFFVGTGNPVTTLAVTPGPITLCKGDTLTISIAGTQPEVNYQLRRNNIAIGTAQQGNGGALDFTVGPLLTPATYSVFATNPGNTCTSTLQQTVPVSLQVPQLAWGPTSFNPVVGSPVDLMNGSQIAGGEFVWNIPGGTPSTSTETEPQGVVFATPGPVEVGLIGITPEGCRDTLVHVLHVIDQPAAQDCGLSQLGINGSNPGYGAVAMNAAGEMFGWMWLDGTTEFVSFSGAGDTLFGDPVSEPDYTVHGVLMKYDPFGVPQWWVDLWCDSPWADHSDVMTDAEGNVYAAYFHGEYLDSLRIVDASGTRTTINPPHNGSGQQSVVVMSFTPNGRLRWVNTFLEQYATEDVNMEFDGQDHLLVQATDHLVQYDRATGEQLWQLTDSYGFRDITVLPNDHIMVTERFNLVMREYDNAGTLLNTTAEYVPTPPVSGLTRLNGWESTRDPAGNIYQLHNLMGGIIIGEDTMYCEGTGNSHLYFFAARNAAGDVLWTRSFEMNSSILVQGLVANDQRVMLSLSFFYTDTLHMDGLPDMPFNVGDTWVLSYALDGSAPQAVRLYAHSGSTIGMYVNGTNAIALSPAGDRMALWASFREPFAVGGDLAVNYTDYPDPQPQGPKNDALVFGDIACVLTDVPPNSNAPLAWFSSPTGYCTGQEIPFADGSLYGPTEWQWEFPGGEPATSTDPDPVVTYALPGTYSVTLTATNANGTGTPYTGTVEVDICTAVHGTAAPSVWRAWPSPASDIIHLRGPASAAARLVDPQGRVVWSGMLRAQDELDVHALPAGCYTLWLAEARVRIAVAR